MAWIWTALSVFVFLYILQQMLSLKKKKRLPPGPRGLPILGHLHLLGKNPHMDLYNLARKHGPIMSMRVGFVPSVIVSSPAAAELILKTHDLVFATRPRLEAARYLGNEQKNLAMAPYGPYWRSIRKLCTLELLSNFQINQFQAMRKAELDLLVSSLKQAAKTGETVDLSARVLALIKDVNCLMMFGNKYVDRDLDERGFGSVITETLEVGKRLNLADYFPYIGVFDLQGLNREMKSKSKILDGFLENIISDHVQKNRENKQTKDFVDTMLAIMDSGEVEFEFDRRHIKAVLLDLLVAGTDTTVGTVILALSELIRHPEIMKKLQKEVELVVGMDQMAEESHLDKLQYLDYVVKEALRLHPVLPLLLPHESVEDCVIDGFHIPKGTRAIVNVWAIGRDPNVWPDPETFSPERFTVSDIDLRGRDFQLIPFGSGRRGCPGLQLALTVVRLVLAQLVHCFDWELGNGVPSSDMGMSENKPLMVIPSYRLSE